MMTDGELPFVRVPIQIETKEPDSRLSCAYFKTRMAMHTKKSSHDDNQVRQAKADDQRHDEFRDYTVSAPFHVAATGLNNIHPFCIYAAHSDHLVDAVGNGDDVIGGRIRLPK
jgi:hypothetical protein